MRSTHWSICTKFNLRYGSSSCYCVTYICVAYANAILFLSFLVVAKFPVGSRLPEKRQPLLRLLPAAAQPSWDVIGQPLEVEACPR
eukprot:970261-Amphidinium_carterae.2